MNLKFLRLESCGVCSCAQETTASWDNSVICTFTFVVCVRFHLYFCLVLSTSIFNIVATTTTTTPSIYTFLCVFPPKKHSNEWMNLYLYDVARHRANFHWTKYNLIRLLLWNWTAKSNWLEHRVTTWIFKWNSTKKIYSSEVCVVDLFKRKAKMIYCNANASVRACQSK